MYKILTLNAPKQRGKPTLSIKKTAFNPSGTAIAVFCGVARLLQSALM
jgi:hypothetical protein